MIEKKEFKIVVGLAAIVLVLVSGYQFHEVNKVPEERKVAVIVLDGGDFKVLDRLKEQGDLPNIEKMEKNGISTNYRTPEAFSPQGWAKMGTGMSTQNISVERKWSYETETGERKRLDSGAVKNRRFWSYLNEDGVETGVYQWLMTWPVEPVKGFMVSSYLTANLNEMSYPEEIKLSGEELKSSLVLFNTFDVSEKLTEEYYGMDVLVYGFHVSDRLQHGFWKYLEDDSPETQKYRELMYRPYKEVDELVGELRPEYTVILVSDHGFAKPWTETYQADINDVLIQIGLTNYSTSQQNMARVKNYDPDAIIAHRYHGNEVLNNTHYRVRFEHLNSDYREEQIEENLSSISYPDGEKLLSDINYTDGYFEAIMYLDPNYMSEEYLEKRHMRLSYARGDLPVLQQNLTLNYGGKEIISKIGPKQTGGHPPRTNGVFYIAGEGIREQGRTDMNINAEDLAPIVLYLKDSKIPEDMDGKVPLELFKPGYKMINSPRFNDREVRRENFDLETDRTVDQEDRINSRLDELGYVG